MKSRSYMDRALQAHDPRYARILGKLGYGRRDVAEDEPAPKKAEPKKARKSAKDKYQRRDMTAED